MFDKGKMKAHFTRFLTWLACIAFLTASLFVHIVATSSVYICTQYVSAYASIGVKIFAECFFKVGCVLLMLHCFFICATSCVP